MSAEVTAVITTHARPHLAREALASVCAETHTEIECVVVDDGGTFEPPAAGSGMEVRVLRGTDLGVAAARNLGLAEARGEFVIFLDDDDIALPNRITALLSAATRFGAGLCYGLTRRAAVDASLTLPHVPTGLMTPGRVGFCDVLTCAPHIDAVLVRTAALRSIGGFDVEARHFDDWSAWLRLADRGVVMHRVADVVAEWRLHGHGLSAELLHARALKARLVELFERLRAQLSEESSRAVAIAQRIVEAGEIVTYDDYVQAMTAARDTIHATGSCLGKRLHSHAPPQIGH